MPSKSQFIIITNESNIHYYHGDFSPMAQELSDKLTGLYAYIAYEIKEDRIFVLAPFKDFKSNHASIALIFNLLKDKHFSFFVPEYQDKIAKFINHGPVYGGEVLYQAGEIIFWNYKSGSYSSSKSDYSDSNPELAKLIMSSVFPAKNFIKTSDTNLFIEKYLNVNFFEPNGKYKHKSFNAIKSFLATMFLPFAPLAETKEYKWSDKKRFSLPLSSSRDFSQYHFFARRASNCSSTIEMKENFPNLNLLST